MRSGEPTFAARFLALHGHRAGCAANRFSAARIAWVFVTTVICATVGNAASFTWDGGHAGQDSWAMNQNWNPNGAPTNDGTADLVFTGNIRLTPAANGGWSVRSMTFDAFAGAFTIEGDAISVQGGVTYTIANNSSYTATITNALTLGSTQTWNANTANLAFTGTVGLGANTLTLTGAANTSISGAISGTGALIKSGDGTLTLTGTNTYSGGTTVSGGALQGNTSSLQGNIANNSAVIFDQATAGSYGGTISGSGSLTKQNAGTLTLTGANTYTGATAVNAGTLALGVASALASTTEVTVASGATLQLAAASQTVGSFSGAGSIDLGANTLTAGASNASTTFSGGITGTGGLVKDGTGTLNLTGTNSYSGGTTVNGGILQGTTSSLTGNINLTAGATSVVFDQASAGTYAGVVSGSGSFTKQSSGTLTLTGANTYTGTTTISAGTLSLGVASALHDTTAVSVSSGATLQLSAANETVGSIAGAGSINLGGNTLTSGGTNASTTFSGAISGTGGLVKNGTGTLALTGTNSYSGTTTINGGTVQGSTSSLPGNIALANNSAVVFDQSTSGTYAGVISGTGSFTKTNTGAVTLSGLNTYSGNTTVSAGTLALGTTNTLPAATNLTLAAGTTLDLAGKSVQVATFNYTTAIVDFGTTVAANSLLFNGGGSGSGTLTIQNFDASTDRLAFSTSTSLTTGYVDGVYFYGIGAGVAGTTPTTIAGYSGTWYLITPNSAAFRTWDGGGGAGNLNWSKNTNWDGNNNLASGTSLKVELAGATSTTNTLDANYTLNTLRFASGANSFTVNSSGGALTFGGAVASIIQLSSNAQTLNVPIALSSTTVVEASGAGALTLGGVVSGATGGINKVGNGTLILSGANTYDGATTINAGTVVARNSTALGSITGGTAVTGGATLQLENNIAVGAEALTLSGTLLNASGTNSYAGTISGSGVVTVNGGSLSLGGTGANIYTGVTTVNTGTLELNKSAGVTAIAGNVTVGNGTGTGTLRLLASNQISDTSAITLHAAGTPAFDLNGFTETVGSVSSSNAAAVLQLGAGSLATGGDNASTTFAGVISGTGGALTKTGTGTLTLSGANTYTGSTTISAGTVVAGTSTALGTTDAGTTVSSGATLQLENSIAVAAEALTLHGTLHSASGTNSYAGAISGSGAVTVNGGSLSLGGTAANTYTGTTTVNSGTLLLNKTAGVTAVSGNLVVGNGGSATASLLANNQIADTSAVTLNSAGLPTLNLNGFSEAIGSLSSANTAATVQLGSGTLTTGGSGASTTFAGTISGSGSLVKDGTGTFTLSGQNSFTGTTTVNAGKLAIGVTNALAPTSNLTLNTDATFSLNGSFSQQLNLLSFTNGTIDFGTTGTANHLVLSNIGTMSGLLTISNWTSGSDVVGIATNTVSQAFLDSVYFTGINVGVGAVLSTTTTNVAGYGQLYILTPIPTFTWSGAHTTGQAADMDNWSAKNNWIGGIAPGIAAVKSFVFAGSVRTTNDMDGAYQVKGLLFRSDAGAFVINSSTGDSLTIGGAGIINESVNAQTLNVSLALSANQTWNADTGNIVAAGTTVLGGGFTLTVDGPFNTTINAAIDASAGGLIKNGAGTLTLAGANAFTGGVTLNAGIVSVGSDGNLGATSGGLTFNGGTLQTSAGITSARAITLSAGGGTFNTNGFNSTLSGVLSGAGSLTKSGAGTLILTGANTYSGGTTISGGTLQGNTTSLQGSIANNAALVFDQAGAGTFAGVISGTGSVTKQNSGVLTLTGANTYSGGTTVSAGTLQGTTSSLQGNITNDAAVVFDQSSSGTYAGVLSGTGTLTTQNSGSVALSGANTYSGATSVNQGTLVLQNSAALGSTAAGTAVASGATLQLENNISVGAEALALAGTMRNASGANSYAGVISGAGAVAVDGGTLTLAGTAANTYSGTTTVNGGTLDLNKTAGQNAVSGALVIGNGSGSATTRLLASNQISDTAAVTLASGGTPTLNLNGFAETVGSVASSNTAATITLGTGGSLSTGGDNSSTTFAGVISGAGSITKQGSGTFTLTGANSYSGGTTVSAGTLQGDSTSLQGGIVNNATVAFNQTSAGSYAGVMSGTGSLTKLGASTLTLTGANTFTGGALVSVGTLQLGANNALAATTALTISNGATFAMNGFTQTIGALAGPGAITLGGGTLNVGNDNVSSTFSGSISGAGVINKIGSGTLTFDNSFSFGGELQLTGGTLNISGINLTVGTLRISGDTVLDFGSSVASVLTATNVIIENGAILTINNWVNVQDYFYATGAFYGYNTTTFTTTPAGFDTRGVAPQNQVVFAGNSGNSTAWLPYDRQITPAPEPATYGALFIGASLGFLGWRRWRTRRQATASAA